MGAGSRRRLLLGRLILGRGWVPTLYDLPVLGVVALATLGHYAFTKRVWYDVLAGTDVGRA